MATKLDKLIRRQTDIEIDDGGVKRKLEIILDPNGTIGFHLSGLKRVSTIQIMDAYNAATLATEDGTEEFTMLTRPVKFRSGLGYKNGSKLTPLCVTIYPDDTVTIGQNGSAASTNLGAIWTRSLVQSSGLDAISVKGRKGD